MQSQQTHFKLATLLHDGKHHKLFHAFNLAREVVIKVSQSECTQPAKPRFGLISAHEKKWASMK